MAMHAGEISSFGMHVYEIQTGSTWIADLINSGHFCLCLALE